MKNLDDITSRLTTLERAYEALVHEVFYERLAARTGNQGDLDEEVVAARYVRSTRDGWLQVRMNGQNVSLPSGLEVDLRATGSGRDHGKVLEGVLRNASFDVASGNLESSYTRYNDLTATVATNPSGPVIEAGTSYDLTFTLAYRDSGGSKSAGPFPATIDKTNPIPPGTHDIEIPDYPHTLGSPYGPRGTVWFRVGHSGDRYIHPGRVSEGCLTCAPSGWGSIYDIMHAARSSGRVNVGKLSIT